MVGVQATVRSGARRLRPQVRPYMPATIGSAHRSLLRDRSRSAADRAQRKAPAGGGHHIDRLLDALAMKSHSLARSDVMADPPTPSDLRRSPFASMDDEFARFQAELESLQGGDAGDQDTAAVPPAAQPQTHVPPVATAAPRHAAPAHLSRPAAVIARPAAPASTVQAPDQARLCVRARHTRTLQCLTPRACCQGGAQQLYGSASLPRLPYVPLPLPPVAHRPPQPVVPLQQPRQQTQQQQQQQVAHVRSAAGEKWVDPTMADWPDSACSRVCACNLSPMLAR